MIRFSYADATIIILGTNDEFSASVTADAGALVYRRPETPFEPVTWTIEHAWQEGKKWNIVTTEVGQVTVQRTGGCGCR